MMISQWRTALALSMLLHLTFLGLFFIMNVKRVGYGDIDYISADLLPFSGGGRRTAISPPQPQETPKEEPTPQAENPVAELEMGLVNKVPVSDPNAPSQMQPVSQPYGGMGGTGVGTYLPYHAVSRIPYFKTQIKPVYPLSERTAGVEARVIVEVYINEHGMVDKVKLVKSGGASFDQAVMSAVQESSFEPGYLEGKPIPVRIQIPYSFKLR